MTFWKGRLRTLSSIVKLRNFEPKKIRQRKRPHRAFISLTYGREASLCHAEQSEASRAVPWEWSFINRTASAYPSVATIPLMYSILTGMGDTSADEVETTGLTRLGADHKRRSRNAARGHQTKWEIF